MRLLSQRVLILIVLGMMFVAHSVQAAESYPVAIKNGVEAKMRDSTILRADIYRPTADGKFPVLLERTPYDKQGSRDFAVKGASRGYVVVVQDVRGRYTSDGDWYPFQNESNDVSYPSLDSFLNGYQ